MEGGCVCDGNGDPLSLSWVLPSIFGALSTIFPRVPFAPRANDRLYQYFHSYLSTPHAWRLTRGRCDDLRGNTIVVSRMSAAHLLTLRLRPSPLVEGGWSTEPQHDYAYPFSAPVPSVFACQTTDHSSFPPPSLSASRVDPIPISPSTCRPIEA